MFPQGNSKGAILESFGRGAVGGISEREKPLLSYRSYVAGEDLPNDAWVYTISSRSLLEDVFTSVSLKRELEQNPDSEAAEHPYVVGRVAVATDEENDRALEAAAAAAPAWATVPLDERMRLGELFREALTEHRQEFLDLLVAEAHPVKLARWELSCLLEVYSRESCHWYRKRMYSECEYYGRTLISHRQPDGVVCLNPPQNAPAPSAALAVLALMAGNTVVVRAPRSIALSTMYVLRDMVVPLLEKVGAPPGTLNVVCGNARRTLDRWVESPLVNDIFYIGGSEEGLRFQERCIAAGKKPILELAGNDTVVVWKDADLEYAAEAVTESFYGSGQICMVPNTVLAHPEIVDDLVERVLEKVAGIRPGFPEDDGVLLSPVRRSEKFFSLLQQALDEGARVVCGGHRTEVDGTRSETGVFLEPTVIRVDGLERGRRITAVVQETFFPLLPIVALEDSSPDELRENVIDFVNGNAYGLRNSLWSRSPRVINNFVTRITNGGLLKVNDSHIGFLPYLPSHGGTGLTGGVFGEANYPMFKTSHLQGVSISDGISPYRAVFGD